MSARRPPRKLSIAPMAGYSDRHFRWIMRQFTRGTLLYSEMLLANQVLAHPERCLAFRPEEKPLAVQIAGHDPEKLVRAAILAQEAGFDEINLNIGCPSPRARAGCFGAFLMAYPIAVAELFAAISNAVSIPVTIKTRIGIAGRDNLEDLIEFVDHARRGGCRDFIIHARSAMLSGLSAKENRMVPRLRHEAVHQLKVHRPGLRVEINGGIRSLEQAELHLQRVDGVMIGRAAIRNPSIFLLADRRLLGLRSKPHGRREVAEAAISYLTEHQRQGGSPGAVLRHLLGLTYERPGACSWRRALSDIARCVNPVRAYRSLVEEMDWDLIDAPRRGQPLARARLER